MEEAELKYKQLQKYIPILERLTENIKLQANEDYTSKYQKYNYLLGILKNGFKSNFTINFLQKVENGLKSIKDTISTRIASSAHIKSEKIDSGSIKMESNFQSPESPPMHHDFKNEREPITIPTERPDCNNYYYDSLPGTSNDLRRSDAWRHDKYDDYNRYNDRKYRGRSRSRSCSRSRSPSYERRHDKKRFRYSRSNSRERDKRDRKYDRSRSRSNSHDRDRRDRKYDRSRSPSRRSKSPHYRYRSDRRDDKRYDIERSYDSKRGIKLEMDSDYKRDSKWQNQHDFFNRRDNRDEQSTTSTRYPNPINRIARNISNIKHEYDRGDSNNQSRFKPSTSTNRFGSRETNPVEEFDLVRDSIKDDEINEMERKTKSMFGTNKKCEELKERFNEINEIQKCIDSANYLTDATLVNDIISELEAVGEFDVDDETVNNLNKSRDEIPKIQIGIRKDLQNEPNIETNFDTRNDTRNEVRNETRKESQARNDVRSEDRDHIQNDKNISSHSTIPPMSSNDRIDSRPQNQRNNRNDIGAENHRTGRTDNRTENRSERLNSSAPISTTTPIRSEERIALSDKYKRRKRISESNSTENNESMQLSDQINVNLQQAQQDPRLRNRPNANVPTSGGFEQFMSFGSPQVQQPPVQHSSMQNLPIYHSPMQNPTAHHSPMQNSFGNNFNRNQTQNPECYPPQRPFYNEPFRPHPHQQQQQSHYPNRPAQHLSPPSNNLSPNVVCGPNSMPQHPRVNQFAQSPNVNPNMNQHQNHSRNRSAKDSYADHKRRMREKREMEERKRKAAAATAAAAAAAAAVAAAVTSTTPQNIASEQNKEPSQQSPTYSPNQTEANQSKDSGKEKTPNKVKKTIFDKAFRGNNWEALPQPIGKTFKIPKLNKTNSDTGTLRTSSDEKRDASETNVSTSTKIGKSSKSLTDTSKNDPRLNCKKSCETNDKRKSSDAKKTTKEKKNDKKSKENIQIHADTTINAESEIQTPEPATDTIETQKEEVNKLPIEVDILKKLEESVSAEKLEQIKKILEGKDQTNDDAVTSSTQPGQSNAECEATNKISKASQPKADVPKTPKRAKKQHLNELDRLNADIRENYPDVLNATGRRACTLNVQKSNENSPTKTPKTAEKPKVSSECKNEDESQCDNDKPRARIVRRRNTTVDSMPYDSDDTPSENTDATPVAKRIARRRGTVCQPTRNNLIDTDEESEVLTQKKPGPETRNNLIDSDEESEELTQKKPGPESASTRNMDNKAVANLPQCSIVLNPREVSREMQRITRSSKRKAEQIDMCDRSESASEENQEIIVVDDSSPEPKRPKDDGKNTDPTMTTKSKRCHICEKSFNYLSSHYANTHEGIEVYSARISAQPADLLRKCPAKEATHKKSKLLAYCYYCEKDVNADRVNWINHFIRHTGEYMRKCSKCGIELTSKTEKTALCGHTSDTKLIPRVEFNDTLFVYMCNICNYTQSHEENLMNHIRNMHDIDVNVTSQYQKIILIPNLRKAKGRTNQRLPSTTSETGSVAHSEELANQDVFKPSSNQDYDVLSDAFKLIKENTFNNSESVPSTTNSIADRLNQRFKKQQENTADIKREFSDGHEIVYRSPEETAALAAAATVNQQTTNQLREGGVIEDMYKIELSKPQASTSGIQSIDLEDTDDPNWESCSSEGGDDDESEAGSQVNTFNKLNILIMRKQKGNKRVKSKKRADKLMLSAMKKETSDDVLDLTKDIKTEKSPIKSPVISNRPVPNGQKRVDNIAYSECLGAQRFNCFIGNCDFLSNNNSKTLQTHVRTKHGTERWNGYCYACDNQIYNGNFSLMKEFDHMMSCHVPNADAKLLRKTPKPQDAATPIAIRKLGLLQSPTPQKPAEKPNQAEPVRPPIIRVRRFSGDNFRKVESSNSPSTPTSNLIVTPNQTASPLNVIMPQQNQIPLQISSAASIPANQAENLNVNNENLDQECGDNPLKPWTKCLNTKTEPAENRLRRECSLVALFKCMANDCIFTTSDKEKMLEHLQHHEDFLVNQASYSKHHSNQDDSSWLECCYCDEIPGSCSTLVEHIIDEHASSIFQCPYCFYRSVDQTNVSSHLKHYHKNREDLYIQVCAEETKSLQDEIDDIVRSQMERVTLVQCPEHNCNKKFMHLIDFYQHIRKDHADKSFHRCPMCPKYMTKDAKGNIDAKHLHDHGFSFSHCAYCLTNCQDVATMHAHLRDEHPTKFPYALVRIPNGLSSSRHKASIAYFGKKVDNEHVLVCSPLTEAQLNFMSPSLSNYLSNASDPPEDNPLNPSRVVVDKAQFHTVQKLEEFHTNEIYQRHGIKHIDALITKSIDKNNETPRPSTSNAQSDYDDMLQNEVVSAAIKLVENTGVEIHELYRCGFESCNWVRSDEREFLMHLSQHRSDDAIYTCVHCKKSYQVPVELKDHIKEHLKHRFFCFYCDMTASTQDTMNNHFKIIHKNKDANYVPINQHNYDMNKDLFVVCPKNASIMAFGNSVINRVSDMLSAKKSYMPDELHLLPKRQIFTEEIQCGRCFFSNKVRSNLIRHFKHGCIEQQAPVNPVPCLSSDIRHFDKMRNLAASSNTSNFESRLGKYVPEGERYVCGAKSCKYQTFSADMLQGHIVTLHESEKDFCCLHCDADLSNTTSTEILNHLRYHDSKIFKCPNCPFIHYLKPQVERHINELHPTSKERSITLERPIKKVEPVKPSTKSTSYKWNCNICSKMFNTKILVKAHLSGTHRLSFQFKCMLCQFSHDNKTTVKDHLLSSHGESNLMKIRSHYERVESEADNSPIWRRDDPTRIEKM